MSEHVEVWTCNQCAWTGFRWNCDNHLRANLSHSVSPKPEVVIHSCGARINAFSLWCSSCKSTVTPVRK